MNKIFLFFLQEKKSVSYVPRVFEVPALLSDIYCSALGTSGSYSTIQLELEALGVSFETTDCKMVLKKPHSSMNDLGQ